MHADLVVDNGWVVSPAGRFLGGVAIRGERIVAVGASSDLPAATRTIDVDGQFIIPGLIDPHVHLSSEEDPSVTEGLAANLPGMSAGMVAGGVTTFGHFAGAPGDDLLPTLDETRTALDRYSHVDGFVHAYVLDRGALKHLDAAADMGVTSFKHFYSAYGRRGLEDKGLGTIIFPVENDVLFESMRWAASRGPGAVVMVHAEDGDLVEHASAELYRLGRKDLAAWSEGRPAIAEHLRVRQAIDLARYTGAVLYIPHMTTGGSCEMVAAARARGDRVFAETGPHWLTHTSAMEDEIGCWGKVNPPLRSTEDTEALWRGMSTGGVFTLGTDDGTGGRLRTTKEKGGGKHHNVWESRPGVRGGSEHMLPVMMTYGVHAGRMTMEKLVELGSANTARVFGLYPRKGCLQPGADADLAVVDPGLEVVVDQDFYHAPNEVSIYDGHRLRGMVTTTIVRGRVAMENRVIVSEPGHGQYLPRVTDASGAGGR